MVSEEIKKQIKKYQMKIKTQLLKMYGKQQKQFLEKKKKQKNKKNLKKPNKPKKGFRKRRKNKAPNQQKK